MGSMRPPKVGKRVIPVMDLTDVRLMVKMCANGGGRYEDARDNAILRVFFETGVRLEEQATMTVEALDLKTRRIKVLGKGDKERWVKVGPKTALALSKYLRARDGFVADRRERLGHSPVVKDAQGRARGEALWVGFKGAMTPSGIGQIVRRRASQAGIDGVHPHRFRHTWAHMLKKKGVTTEELMELAGWSTDTMPRLYGFSAAADRALETADRLRLGDDI
jgi:site-specific recombinase XerD